MHQRYQTLYCPTNVHNFKNVELLKQFKIKEAAPTCFGVCAHTPHRSYYAAITMTSSARPPCVHTEPSE